MRILRVAIAWLLLTGSSCALGHAHLTKSAPADGAHLATAPTVLELHFSEAAQLTAVWIQKAGEAKHKLAAPADKPGMPISIVLPTLGRGEYVVSWRALGSDGHVAPGELHFVID